MLKIKTKFDNKIINKCPAKILATNRTIRVIGRIKFLVTSIKNNKKVKIKGVPSGIKWERVFLGELKIENIIIINHIVKEVKNIILTCEE